MRSAEPRSKRPGLPCPSGVLAGNPSAISLMPRVPNCERAPNPRIVICSSCAKFSRFCTKVPGARLRTSEMLTRALPSWISERSIASIDIGRSNARASVRVPVTTTGARVSVVVCAMPSGRANTPEAAATARREALNRLEGSRHGHGTSQQKFARV